jgi:beta-1,4-mannosyltransferase
LGAAHPAVHLAHAWERWFARRAERQLSVSSPIPQDNARRRDISDATVLRDLPAARFHPLPAEERAELRRSVGISARPTALLVSASSWTADEDFTLLFDALEICHARLQGEESYPDVVLFLTGRGPLHEMYRQRAAALPKGRIRVEFAWLSQERYGALLGAADLGVCVHRSSSGVDLPMKIADMHGAGLPVCAYDYGPCLAEMIAPGETGLLFKDARQLATQLCDLLHGFDRPDSPLARMRSAVAARRGKSWAEGWEGAAAPLLGFAPRA